MFANTVRKVQSITNMSNLIVVLISCSAIDLRVEIRVESRELPVRFFDFPTGKHHDASDSRTNFYFPELLDQVSQ